MFSRQSKLFAERLAVDLIYEPVGLKEGEQGSAELIRASDYIVSIQNVNEIDHVVPLWISTGVDVIKQGN